MNINNTYNINSQNYENPLIAHEKIIAQSVRAKNNGNYRIGDLVKANIAIPLQDNQIQAEHIDLSLDTNANLQSNTTMIGIISCIHDLHGCEYLEVDLDGINLVQNDILLQVIWSIQPQGLKVEAKLPLTYISNGGIRQILQVNDFILGGSLLENIILLRNPDQLNTIIQFQ